MGSSYAQQQLPATRKKVRFAERTITTPELNGPTFTGTMIPRSLVDVEVLNPPGSAESGTSPSVEGKPSQTQPGKLKSKMRYTFQKIPSPITYNDLGNSKVQSSGSQLGEATNAERHHVGDLDVKSSEIPASRTSASTSGLRRTRRACLACR